MAVVNQHVEDDNNNELNRIDACKEANMKREMIRMYDGTFEDDNNHGSTVSVPTQAEVELMIRVYKDTICPMICAEINRKHKKFLYMVHEKYGLDLSMWMTCRNLHKMEGNFESQSLQLKFLNGISTPVSTGKIIEGNERKPFLLALVDEISGQIVTTGAEAAMEVEIVVLEGDSNDDEADKWTSDEFNDKIVSEWNGKKILQGKTFVKLNEGTVFLDNISLTHNSVWKGQRKCRMGARFVNPVLPIRVKEAKTESFFIGDKCNFLYKKHKIPSLSDHLFRLYKISRRGDCFERLTKAHIKTVMDLLTLHAINPQRLQDILNVRPNVMKIIMDHAKMCKDDKGIYLYHYPRDGQKRNGVVFNIFGHLVGIVAESHFILCDKIPDDERVDAQKLIVSSSEHWEELVPFNDQDSLISHLQPRTTLNLSFPTNLSVVIPQTIYPNNHPNLTSPKSQSPKRPASEHGISNSNSPKQPKYNNSKLSPSTPSVGIDTSMRHKVNNWESKPDENDDDIMKS